MIDKREKPIGCSYGWDGAYHLYFSGGRMLWGSTDRKLYSEYWKGNDGGAHDYPRDPETGKRLPFFTSKHKKKMEEV